ncbi:transcriptional regulator, MerR family protein [Paractinoplanes abujensis]|uniref:DNA-binding transcriptional MerR regulator n=1 Tax=Paractinoplanes abujensis TaxID=882441 RepID=A0A7W7CMU9_9ACTN|nr:MerR family transcriptional regulator [Actinoplanes abujensis]MBB4689973.1 DNA-binding transcriptional MerR regulator [Actinoplanes abujensis]GID20746.1 transcriptional regulator, MerR family protein [Actinoplanes abujensis]
MIQEVADVAWSTRELAELAGTTVNTIRHYHRLGLLEDPERRYNGYKQYGVPHLVCLLRIRRLVELGVPLSEIGTARTNGDVPPEVLRQVDTQLAAEIERLQRARADIAVVLRDGAPADTPAGFESVAPHLSAADTSLIHVYTRLYDGDAMKDLQRMAEADHDHPVNAELDALPADADEATRQSIAERLAPIIARNLTDYPWLNDPSAHLSQGEQATTQTFVDAVVALYNAAQVDVLGRAAKLAIEQVRRSDP